jgi:hypothetical protein
MILIHADFMVKGESNLIEMFFCHVLNIIGFPMSEQFLRSNSVLVCLSFRIHLCETPQQQCVFFTFLGCFLEVGKRLCVFYYISTQSA